MYLSLNSEVYFKQTFNIDVFIMKLWYIPEVDLLNLWIYLQTQNIFEVDFLNKLFLFKLFVSFLFLYFIYTSFRKFLQAILLLDFKGPKYKWSILKVYLKYTSHIVFSVYKG